MEGGRWCWVALLPRPQKNTVNPGPASGLLEEEEEEEEEELEELVVINFLNFSNEKG